jgi:hypothetical protein
MTSIPGGPPDPGQTVEIDRTPCPDGTHPNDRPPLPFWSVAPATQPTAHDARQRMLALVTPS